MDKDDPFIRPIRPLGEEDRDRLKISPIEPIRDPSDTEESDREAEIYRRKVAPNAAFITFFQQLLEVLSLGKTAEMAVMREDILVKDIETLKILFKTLSEKDQSENITFVQNLSDAWGSLVFHCDSIESGRMKSSISPKKIRSLVASVGKYPQGIEHNLGHYLKHHAGKDWLPFPLMELLKKLHRSFAVDAEKSHLATWLHLLNQLVPGKDIT